jgi:hypothetical protein
MTKVQVIWRIFSHLGQGEVVNGAIASKSKASLGGKSLLETMEYRVDWA